jgi:hypothetical protein
MTEQSSPVDVAVAFTEAWTTHDLATAAGYLAEDVVFDGPMQQSTGAGPYMDGLTAFATAVTGMRVLAAFGNREQALIMYEVTTGPFGTVTCAEHFTVRDGKIEADRLTFDTYEVRKARAAQVPPAGE